MPWREKAKRLSQGAKVRYAHCDSAKDALVSHGDTGYSLYCFKCGAQEFEGHGYRTLDELKQTLANAKAQVSSNRVTLPQDTVFVFEDFSREARLWLLRAAIYGDRLTKSGIGYSHELDRVVLPVFDEYGVLVFYQLRKISERDLGPKYLAPAVDKATLTYAKSPESSHGQVHGVVVVVEDILSTIRVGEHVHTVCLLGTSLSDAQAAYLSQFDHVLTWLDNDAGGDKGRAHVQRKMQLVSDVTHIRTDLDPKEYSNKDIRKTLCQNYPII